MTKGSLAVNIHGLPSGPPQATKSSLLHFTSCCAIDDDTFAFAGRAPATDLLGIRSVADVSKEERHDRSAQY